ncbi:hypothetical protein GCM10007862_08680 [Dyella lipolytica]|uniref:Uncharacterized protein n=1 Tax=Dyella lipolytica TaxID=1867835 RepID=A0ABW8J025_9GAMM|nr:DUF6519 domain-containing protein [Dyella lipolytica]GLQ45817.1 hypothetical protein GCM10007862_08680 [Dyella lipolytica]
MKGDFSRIRFEPGKHYTDVLKQQGRTELDADGNEQRFIDDYRLRTETVDVIGEYGGPVRDPGFAISVVGYQIHIGAGRYYVDGLLCENTYLTHYDDQVFLIDPTSTQTAQQLLQELARGDSTACLHVFLEVWQRMVTALDDTCLGEPALGQADTTVRLQTVWRVVASLDTPKGNPIYKAAIDIAAGAAATAPDLMPGQAELYQATPTAIDTAANAAASLSIDEITREMSPCCRILYKEIAPKHTGSLYAQTAENSGDCGCQPVPAAGYTGLENQLYRVEIHESGDLSSATFKWSRENASVVVAVLNVSGTKVTVNSLGMDANLGFQTGQWVEISDDTNLFGETPNQPGTLYQIQSIDPPSMTLTMTATVQNVDTGRNARMRRWDQTDTTATTNGIPVSSGWITLENGIEVCFGKGNYVAGDYWTIPARSATGTIDWPPCGSDGNWYQPPFYTVVHRAPLACICLRDSFGTKGRDIFANTSAFAYQDIFKVDDCRLRFPTLTDLGGLIQAEALHITKINWKNDDVMTLDRLIHGGLAMLFDQPPTSPLTPANVIVTLETPILISRDTNNNYRAVYAFSEQGSGATSPLVANKSALLTNDAYLEYFNFIQTVPRNETILDSTVTLTKNTLRWTLPYENASAYQKLTLFYLDLALLAGMTQNLPTRVRVKLPGRTHYASPAGGAQIYLDGQAFGQSAAASIGKRERIDLQFPTGNSERASDFESWFYLYPVLTVSEVTLTYSALTVQQSGNSVTIVGSTPSTNSSPIVQQAQIALNYRAVEAATISLSLLGDGSVASVPSSVAVNPGDESVSVTIAINGAPADGQTESFTLTASITSAIGSASAQNASFTVTGQAAPVQTQ